MISDEDTIQAMLDMLENKTITSQLPMMNSMNKGGKNDSKENDESAKAKKETLMTILKGCNFEKLLALMCKQTKQIIQLYSFR